MAGGGHQLVASPRRLGIPGSHAPRSRIPKRRIPKRRIPKRHIPKCHIPRSRVPARRRSLAAGCMSGIEGAQSGECRLEAAAETPECGRLLPEEFMVQGLDGRAERLAGHRFWLAG